MTHNRCLIIIGILAGSTLAVLAFGNPQWHKSAYVFQCMLHGADYMSPPTGHTGPWKSWSLYDGEWVANPSFFYYKGMEFIPISGMESEGDNSNWYTQKSMGDNKYLVSESTSQNYRTGGEPNRMLMYTALQNPGMTDFEYSMPDSGIKLKDFIWVYDKFNGIDRRAEFGIPVK